MKTSVELDDEKVAIAKQLAQSVTLRKVLDLALDAFISQARRHKMANMLGKDFFEGNLAKMRKRNGLSRR